MHLKNICETIFKIKGAQPGIFGAGEVSCNKGTSINVTKTVYEKRSNGEKFWCFFLQDTLKTAI